MPTYQYACTACDHRFDAVQSFSDPSLTECPVCSGTLRKVFSSVGIVFKGSGFYRTDSRAGAGSTVAAPSGDSGAKSDSPASSEKSSESKNGESKKSDKKSEKSTASSSSGGSSSGSTASAAKS